MASNIACKLTRNDIAASELRKNMGFDNVLRLVFGLEIMSLFKNNFLKKISNCLGMFQRTVQIPLETASLDLQPNEDVVVLLRRRNMIQRNVLPWVKDDG